MDKLTTKSKKNNTRSYIKDTLYTEMDPDAKKYLLSELGVVVCPYCNRNYIYSEDDVHTCELDHFLPKSKYPIFAVSFYNLIPACPRCNFFKKENMFSFYPHDLNVDTDKLLTFTYSINQGDYLYDKNAIEIKINTHNSEYEEQKTILKLDKLYKHHKDIVLDILRKHHIFSNNYIKNLQSEFSNLFTSPQEVEELIYGISMKKEEYGDRPLTKLIQDILTELNQSKY